MVMDATVGFLGRKSWSVAAIAGIAAVIGIESLVMGLGVGFWAVNTLVVVTLGGVCINWSETNKANAELMRQQSEIERLAKIAERERIARDLHDLPGHTLSVSVLKARLAAGTHCGIELSMVDQAVVLEVADNGRGGAPGGVIVAGAGLSGMRERVESLGGLIDIDGRTGTMLRVQLPLVLGPTSVDSRSVQHVA